MSHKARAEESTSSPAKRPVFLVTFHLPTFPFIDHYAVRIDENLFHSLRVNGQYKWERVRYFPGIMPGSNLLVGSTILSDSELQVTAAALPSAPCWSWAESFLRIVCVDGYAGNLTPPIASRILEIAFLNPLCLLFVILSTVFSFSYVLLWGTSNQKHSFLCGIGGGILLVLLIHPRFHIWHWCVTTVGLPWSLHHVLSNFLVDSHDLSYGSILRLAVLTTSAFAPTIRAIYVTKQQVRQERTTVASYSERLDPDEHVRPCTISFGHNSAEGIQEAIPWLPLPKAVTNLQELHHWCLIFEWDPFKISVCELSFDENQIILGVYRPWDRSADSKRYHSLTDVTTRKLSPMQASEAVQRVSLNGLHYAVKGRSCQEWLCELGTLLGIENQLKVALERGKSFPPAHFMLEGKKKTVATITDVRRCMVKNLR